MSSDLEAENVAVSSSVFTGLANENFSLVKSVVCWPSVLQVVGSIPGAGSRLCR